MNWKDYNFATSHLSYNGLGLSFGGRPDEYKRASDKKDVPLKEPMPEEIEEKLADRMELLVKRLKEFREVLSLEDSVISVNSISGKKTRRLDRSMNPFIEDILDKYEAALKSGNGIKEAVNRTVPFWKRVKYWWTGTPFLERDWFIVRLINSIRMWWKSLE